MGSASASVGTTLHNPQHANQYRRSASRALTTKRGASEGSPLGWYGVLSSPGQKFNFKPNCNLRMVDPKAKPVMLPALLQSTQLLGRSKLTWLKTL